MITELTRKLLNLPDNYVDDIGGITLASFWPLIEIALNSTSGNIVEIGADRGYVTTRIAKESAQRGRKFYSVDPSPASSVDDIANVHHMRMKSIDFLENEDVSADLWIIDGDHNYRTVMDELTSIVPKVSDGPSVLLLHDLGWPSGRRDQWYNPEEAPMHAEFTAAGRTISLDESGTVEKVEGISLGAISAISPVEGGPSNGVLTAVEDFLKTPAGAGWQLMWTPVLFGFGILFRTADAAALSHLISKFNSFNDVSAVLASVEANRLRLLQTLNQKWVECAQKDVELVERREALSSLSGLTRFLMTKSLSKMGFSK